MQKIRCGIPRRVFFYPIGMYFPGLFIKFVLYLPDAFDILKSGICF